MAVLGGMRSFWGPLLGAAVFISLEDYLSAEAERWSVQIFNWPGHTLDWMFWIGLLFVIVVLLFPRGLLGVVQRGKA